MNRLPLAFFTVAALCALAGMLWGILMASSNDFTTAPAHAHLNLLGWASLAIMGGFYALADDHAPRFLGWLNFALSSLGVVVIVPALADMLGGDKSVEPIVAAGSVLALAGMAVFFLAVVSVWRVTLQARVGDKRVKILDESPFSV
jgi:ABC-type transport system involved in cytochrome c biogenesis permease subunit